MNIRQDMVATRFLQIKLNIRVEKTLGKNSFKKSFIGGGNRVPKKQIIKGYSMNIRQDMVATRFL